MSDSWHWTCPFCKLPQIATEGQRNANDISLEFANSKYSQPGFAYHAVACSNEKCGEVDFFLHFGEGQYNHGNYRVVVQNAEYHQIRPSHSAKVQPDCVPKPMAHDYYEACKIRDLSPKASATLARRVLQGMIRDFCGVKEKTLFAEIGKLKKLCDEDAAPREVEPRTIEAMHDVRKLGNIGAHMQADTDVIVDVDLDEAQLLIDLIEMLFDDWYVARFERDARLSKLKAAAESKKLPKADVPINDLTENAGGN